MENAPNQTRILFERFPKEGEASNLWSGRCAHSLGFEGDPLEDLPIHPGQQSVPVYDCHVLISGPDQNGQLSGVVSNLPEIKATASNERELLRKMTDQFKARVMKYISDNEEIPWQESQKPEPGQQQRWIPVHL